MLNYILKVISLRNFNLRSKIEHMFIPKCLDMFPSDEIKHTLLFCKNANFTWVYHVKFTHTVYGNPNNA